VGNVRTTLVRDPESRRLEPEFQRGRVDVVARGRVEDELVRGDDEPRVGRNACSYLLDVLALRVDLDVDEEPRERKVPRLVRPGWLRTVPRERTLPLGRWTVRGDLAPRWPRELRESRDRTETERFRLEDDPRETERDEPPPDRDERTEREDDRVRRSSSSCPLEDPRECPLEWSRARAFGARPTRTKRARIHARWAANRRERMAILLAETSRPHIPRTTHAGCRPATRSRRRTSCRPRRSARHRGW
jgi:hypothetical protein